MRVACVGSWMRASVRQTSVCSPAWKLVPCPCNAAKNTTGTATHAAMDHDHYFRALDGDYGEHMGTERPRDTYIQIILSATLGVGAFLTFCVSPPGMPDELPRRG